MDAEERNWKEINTDIDLYKFYLDLLIKSATFFFAITGAMLGWYFTQINQSIIKYSLIIPIIMNMGLVLICGLSIRPAKLMKKDFEETCVKAGFSKNYDMSTLINVLYLFLFSYSLIIVGLFILLFTS